MARRSAAPQILCPYPSHELNASSEMIREDRGDTRLCDAIECVLRNCDPVERCFRAFQIGRRCHFPVAAFCVADHSDRLHCRRDVRQLTIPRSIDVGADAFHGGEDMRADRTVGILNCDRDVQDGL